MLFHSQCFIFNLKFAFRKNRSFIFARGTGYSGSPSGKVASSPDVRYGLSWEIWISYYFNTVFSKVTSRAAFISNSVFAAGCNSRTCQSRRAAQLLGGGLETESPRGVGGASFAGAFATACSPLRLWQSVDKDPGLPNFKGSNPNAGAASQFCAHILEWHVE